MVLDPARLKKVIQELKKTLADDRPKAAMQLLRHADAGGALARDGSAFDVMKAAVGATATKSLIEAFSEDACPYCKGGREKCGECGGDGFDDDSSACNACAGFGLRRCPFCNGTSLAGYDFVPRSFRPSVVQARLKTAEAQLTRLSKNGSDGQIGSRDLAKRILGIDRCRGVVANAVEQTNLHKTGGHGGAGLFSEEERERLTCRCHETNRNAEIVIRRLLKTLGDNYASKAERPGRRREERLSLSKRAQQFSDLSGAEDFGGSALKTPLSLRDS